MPKNNYTEEFKREAAKLALEKTQPLTQTAAELKVSLSGLRGWMKRYGEQKASSAPTDAEATIRKLEKENRLLKMEREILKKATAFFAKDQL